MFKNKGFLFIVIALIIIVAGMIMFFIKGMNYEENTMGLKDLTQPYIIPMLVSFLIITVYYIVKYRKIGILKVIEYTLIGTIGIQLVFLSIYSITRLKINFVTMPISIIIYALTFLVLTDIFDKCLKNNSTK